MARDIRIAIIGDATRFKKAISEANGTASKFSTGAKIALAGVGAVALKFGKDDLPHDF